MSAERLREAAKVLRERAEAATPGPWSAAVNLGGVPNGVDLSLDPCVFAVVHSDAKPDRLGGDTTYIATMHPGVGLALADWLDKAAEEWEVWGEHDRNIDQPMIVADFVLGRTP